MAPKKKAAPQPPLPPPAESSDETRSGSRSRSDESDDEEAIADSPVPAATPTLKNTPAPSQKGGESESSEEEEEDEEEEEPVPAPPKNQPPPPQKNEVSETSGDDEDDDEDDEEEEPTRAAPPSAPEKQPPPQPQKEEDSDTSGDEGESDEEEAPPPKPAPKKDAEALKPPAAAETKKPGAVQRIWSTDDELRILEALAAHQKQHGTLPQPDALVDVLAGKLDKPAYGSKELHFKVRNLRTRYLTLNKRAELPTKEHDRRLLDLSKMVWDSGDKTTPAAAAAANGHGRKGFEEMCELYPYLAEEVKELEAARPGMCKREFGKMDHDKARSMDEKIKKQRVLQIKVEMGRANLVKEVTKALVDLVDG